MRSKNTGELTMSHLYLLGVATLTLTSAGFAGSDTNADLQDRIDAAVEARIAELTVGTNNNWLNDARSDEIRGLVHDVLADADTRASLQGSGSNAGYNDGFTVASSDGNWTLKMNGLLQTSWSNVDDADDDDQGWGFDTGTTWMNFSGTIAGDYSYDVRYNWAGTAIDAAGDEVATGNLEWANASFAVGDGWGFTMGTQKAATARISLIDDQNQLGINDEDYVVGNGVTLDYTGDQMRAWIQLVNAGLDGGANNDSQYAWNVRAEYMVEGNWGQFDQFTSADGGEAGTLIGFSYGAVNSDGATDGDSNWTIDAQMQFGGSNLYVAYNESSDDDGDDTDTLYVAYGIYLNADWEAYVQYEDVSTDDDPLWVIGVNNYWAGQNARWSTELHMNEQGNSDTTTITTQLQFYF
jgi:hypothetical protein